MKDLSEARDAFEDYCHEWKYDLDVVEGPHEPSYKSAATNLLWQGWKACFERMQRG